MLAQPFALGMTAAQRKPRYSKRKRPPSGTFSGRRKQTEWHAKVDGIGAGDVRVACPGTHCKTLEL